MLFLGDYPAFGFESISDDIPYLVVPANAEKISMWALTENVG
jgi:hypothetical protein